MYCTSFFATGCRHIDLTYSIHNTVIIYAPPPHTSFVYNAYLYIYAQNYVSSSWYSTTEKFSVDICYDILTSQMA